MPDPRDRYFVEPPGPPTYSLTDSPTFETRVVQVRMPRWATDEMIYRIIRAITRWRYAHTNPTELVVWVPRAWLTEDDLVRGLGSDSSILGVPLRYGPVPEVIVGVSVTHG